METVQSVRIDHGSVSGSAMAYSQRQPSNHRLFSNMTKKVKKPKMTVDSDLTIDRNDLFSNIGMNCMEPNIENCNNENDNIPAENNKTVGNNVLIFDGQVLNNTEFNGVIASNDDLIQIKSEVIHIKNEIQNLKTEIVDIKKQFVKTNLVLDKIYDMIEKNSHITENPCTINETTDNLLEKFIFPLKSCEEVVQFDKELRTNNEFKKQVVAFLMNIGGRNGDSDGKKIAYKLFDTLFTPNVATKYSWTGITRGKLGEEKKSFQVFQGIINVFFETLVCADNRYTKTKNEQFFREGVLKHSKKRSLRIKGSSSDMYKPSRSPLGGSPARYSYPGGGSAPVPPPPAQPRYLPAQPPPQQYAYRDYRPPRISLLHSEYSIRPRGEHPGSGPAPAPTSLSTPAASPGAHVLGAVQQPPAHAQLGPHPQEAVVLASQPFKKIRLQEPLRIDTRDQPGSYNPQVEAISPTLPDHHIQEDQAFKTTKDELLQQIGKVDREIAKAESQISILKKKQAELEEIASKPAIKQDVEEVAVPKHQSLAQKIYAENRKKAQAAHSLLDTLGPKVDMPIYNQPSDTTVYHENKRRHQMFKRRLLEYFKKRHAEKESRESYLTQTYSKLMQEWLRKVDKIESSQKRKAKEAKNREFFEKVFPELRKQREDKERFNRVGARIKSEADLEEIMDGLQEQEMEDKKMRSYAVIPPILLDARQRKLKYVNNNGHILDMESEYKERQLLNVWTPSENEVFKEKYLQHPKNFGVIASYLDRKSVQDCVQHYYLTKKTENYKQLLRKSRQRTRASRNNPQKVNNSANNSVVDILTTGVTTRLQREQQQKTVQVVQQQTTSETSSTTTTTVTTTTSAVASTAATTTTTAANGTTVVASTVTPTKTSQADEKAQTKVVSSNNVIVNTSASSVVVSSPSVTVKTEESTTTTEARETNHEPTVVTANSDQSNPAAAVENKKKKERRKDKDTSMETSDDDECTQPGTCTICKSSLGPHLHSRPLLPVQGPLYGLREEEIPPNGRVCNTCRCKSVRSRYTYCPLPTCPNARSRVKRLRSLPSPWAEIPGELRDPIVQDFQIPNGCNKSCTACYNRIQRRLACSDEWADHEINRLKMLLTEMGAVWPSIGERLGRCGPQVKAFYCTNRKRFGLESCLGDSKPILSDDDESGSSTSSCEEQPLRDRHSSDTASAESPPAQPEQPQGPTRKEDYDSSATETADEGQTPDHYQGSATITVVNSDGQPRQGNSSPMTVKDLMSNVIELQLMKNSGAVAQPHTPASGMTPTISSILNIDSPDVTIIREYNLNNQPTSNNQNDLNLARLVTPLIAATITPVPAPGPPEQPQQREELVVLQVDGRDSEPMTLDLSLKKPRDPVPPPAHAKHPMSIHRTEPYIQYHHGRKSPAVYVSTVARTQPKLPSPKPANPKAGSITLGTPVISQQHQQQRYDGLLRQMPQDAKMGSITQGTPIHVPAHLQEKRMYEYYKRQPQQGNAYPTQYRSPAYAVEQQLSSKQIIMNDYITSQQMHGPRRVEKPTSQPTYYIAGSPHRTPPPQPQRQGVIQRHTRPQQPHYPPGHEALSSLVDVAVQQPSLPVPAAPHEGLGKTIVDHLSEPHHRFHLAQMQQIRHQQRFVEERRAQMAYREHQAQQQAASKQHQQAQQQPPRGGDSSTMTAASLIDAIITHQINQPTETGGREVVANSREPPRPSDRLFSGFHRDPTQNQGQPENNGDRSPSVISVDLDAEPQNKSMTVKEITDSVINMDFRQPGTYYHQENIAEQWKRRLQKEEKPRSGTPQTDERQIIRIAQPQQKYQPVSPPENNHWPDGHGHDYRKFGPPQSHISALDYVKHRIVEVMRTEDDKRDEKEAPHGEKERSDSPGPMVIDEDKHEAEFQQQPSNFAYAYSVSALNVPHGVGQISVSKSETPSAADNARTVEPKPLMSAQYEPLSDED